MGFFSDEFIYCCIQCIGSFTAAERAAFISDRIHGLSDIFNFTSDSLKLVDAETSVDLFYGDKIIMSITESDALWNNTSKDQLANKYKEIIGNVVKYHNDRSQSARFGKEYRLGSTCIHTLRCSYSLCR